MLDPLRRSLLFLLALVTFAVVCARFGGGEDRRTSALVAIEEGRTSASSPALLQAATSEARASVRLYEEALRTSDPVTGARAARRAALATGEFRRYLDAVPPRQRAHLRRLVEDALANAASLSSPINVEPQTPEELDDALRLQRRVVRLELLLDEIELFLAQRHA